ncbi:MAG: type IV pilus modification protein PilV [Gammaproteobacteria bacterium]|nr:type IV pilus modification protein PilV [Gammaproteobacteria bacterium]
MREGGPVRSREFQRGVTLVESLVALVVVSVGMLGVAAMYVDGLRASRTSTFRQAAVTLASDLADRIRLNPAAGVAYAGDDEINDCVNGDEDCSPEELAADDLAWWRAEVGRLLPGGDAEIDVDAGAVPEVQSYSIALSWVEPGATDLSRYVLEIEL